MKRHKLSCSFEIERLEEDGTVEGTAGIFGTFIEQDRVIVLPGAFKRTLNSWKEKGGVPMTLEHQVDVFIGALTGEETNTGLRVKGKIDRSLKRGQQAYTLAKEKKVRGFSISFTLVEDKTEIKETDSGPVYYARELKLREIALVARPADGAAKIEAVRMAASNKEAWIQAKAALLIAEDYDPDKATRVAKAMWDAMDIGTESTAERVKHLYSLIKKDADPEEEKTSIRVMDQAALLDQIKNLSGAIYDISKDPEAKQLWVSIPQVIAITNAICALCNMPAPIEFPENKLADPEARELASTQQQTENNSAPGGDEFTTATAARLLAETASQFWRPNDDRGITNQSG